MNFLLVIAFNEHRIPSTHIIFKSKSLILHYFTKTKTASVAMTLFHVSSKKAVCQNFYMMYNFELSTCIIFRLEIMKTVSVLRKGMESVHYFMYGWKKKTFYWRTLIHFGLHLQSLSTSNTCHYVQIAVSISRDHLWIVRQLRKKFIMREHFN